jgi:glycosyltransferase involved in cell wall biosynthesis
MEDPSFSIVIPTYERCDLVCDTVRVLGEQSYRGEFEVIVVVDGSTDGTTAALAKLGVPFPLSIIEQENGGAAHARNRGAAEASGDIILFVDDDMVCSPDLLEQHARLYRSGADAITGEITPRYAIPEDFQPRDLPRFAPPGTAVPATAFDVFTGHLSVKRSVFDALGGFDEDYTARGGYGNEDLDFGARLLANYDVRISPAAITIHVGEVKAPQVLRRAKLLADADVRFAGKHPDLAGELFERRGASATMTRLLYRPIGRVPLLAPAIASIAMGIAHAALKTGVKSSRITTRLFSIAYGTSYWSQVSSGLRLLHSGQQG